MSVVIVLFGVLSVVMAGYSGSSSTSNKVGNGYGYGYSGSFSDGGGGGFPTGNLPGFPQFDFSNFLQSYLNNLRQHHEQFASNALSYSYTTADANSAAEAKSSLIFQGNGIMQQTQQNAFPGYGFPGGYPAYAGFQGQGPAQGGGSFSGHYGGGEGAAASAAIGPQGIHQTAGVYPENPNNPNINTRFGGQGGPGFHSVSTQSFSSSANVDGQPSSYHQASTTVNDNGKVTTYTVRKP